MGASAVAIRRGVARSVQRPYPGWWLVAAAGAAWVGLVVAAALADGDHGAQPGAHSAHHPPSVESTHGTVSWGLMWLAMVVAMMWPLYAAQVDAITRASFRRWRPVVATAYLTAISALWVATGLVGHGAYLAAGSVVPGWLWSTAWLLFGLAMLRALWRWRLLRDCSRRTGTVAPRGRRAVTSAMAAGARAWPRCAALCGPVMLAMVPAHSLVVMLGGSLAVWWEQRHPRSWHDPVPALLLAVTVVAVIAIELWGGML